MERSTAPPSRWRILGDLLLGACIAAGGAALVGFFYPGFWQQPDGTALEAVLRQRQVLQEEARRQAAHAAVAPANQPAAAPSACDLAPLIPPGNAEDGHAAMEHPFPAGPRAKAKVFLRAAEAAAARGRPRDAELALIAACSANEAAAPGPTVPLARVFGLLGEGYLAAGASPGHPAPLREQLLSRARRLLELSAANYATALGPNASRSRQARERVATLDRQAAAATDATDAPAWTPEPLAVARPQPPKPPRQAAPPAPAQPAAIRRAPVSDPELGQLDADLARLRAQADAVSDDPAGVARRDAAARVERDRCRDAPCLRDWYAARRRQLLDEF